MKYALTFLKESCNLAFQYQSVKLKIGGFYETHFLCNFSFVVGLDPAKC
jgi:hypothetical protein